MSRIVDGLVGRQLVIRQTPPEDRRRVSLALTASGQEILQLARKATQARLAEALMTLSEAQRISIIEAMRILRPLFT
jgi:DNA-binding MarR family transcriptional regulator